MPDEPRPLKAPPTRPVVTAPSKAPSTADLARARETLNEELFGQKEAIDALLAVMTHHRLQALEKAPVFRAPGVVLIGERGVGKSTLARMASTAMGLPYYDALIERVMGWPSDDYQSLFGSAAQRLAVPVPSMLLIEGLEQIGTRFREGEYYLRAQRLLIRALEGQDIEVPSSGRDLARPLIRCLPTFVVATVTVDHGLLPPAASLNELRTILLEFGWLPDLVARFSVIIQLQSLSIPSLRKIFMRRLKQANQVLAPLNAKISCGEDALHAVLEHVLEHDEGAWIIDRLMAKIMQPVLLDPGHHHLGAQEIRPLLRPLRPR